MMFYPFVRILRKTRKIKSPSPEIASSFNHLIYDIFPWLFYWMKAYGSTSINLCFLLVFRIVVNFHVQIIIFLYSN